MATVSRYAAVISMGDVAASEWGVGKTFAPGGAIPMQATVGALNYTQW
jgi:hypothetical protein